MLVTITIIVTLALLVFTLSSRAINNAQKAVCVQNLRGIGNALQMYITEKNGRLPGPLNTGQSALYNKDARSLVTYIGPYLEEPRDSDEPYLIANYGCPALMKRVKENTVAKPPVVYRLEDRQNKLLDNSIPPNDISYPWGYAAGSTPKRLDQINPVSAGKVRMITEQNTTLGVGGWSNGGPTAPAHGKQSMAMYWDFSVRPVALTQL